MLTYPGFNPIAFSIGPVKVHWYGIMYLFGFASGWWLGRVRAARPGSTWKPNDVDDFVFFTMVGGILGGRIGYILFYGLKFWAADPWLAVMVISAGSFFAALAGPPTWAAVLDISGRHAALVFGECVSEDR